VTGKRVIVIAAFLVILGIALWFALPKGGGVSVRMDGEDPAGAAASENAGESPGTGGIVKVDGETVTGPLAPSAADAALRVVVTVDGETVAEVPFGEEHRLEITGEAGRNVIRMTKDAVWMEEADCPGNDCVHMGQYTRDNWETRQMIVCLPHHVSIQVTD